MSDETSEGNQIAPEGKVFVCTACGKRSKDQYGKQAISHGWDISCMLNCELFDEADLVLHNPDDPTSRVVRIEKKPPNPPSA